MHIFIPSTKEGKKVLDIVANKFYCPAHMPKEDSDDSDDDTSAPMLLCH